MGAAKWDGMMNRNQLYAAVIKMVAGTNTHQQALLITHTTPAGLQGVLDTARNNESLFQRSRNGKQQAQESLKSAKSVGKDFAVKARDALRPFFGTKWSVGWSEAGFKNQTLAIPEPTPDLSELLRSLRAYFVNHSNHQNTVALVTEENAAAHLAGLTTAVGTVSTCRREQRVKRLARDTTEAQLYRAMRKLEFELKAILELDDPRWLDFVDEIPGETSRPEAVEEVEVEGDGPGRLAIDWAPSVRAERYLVEIMAGEETELRRVATVHDPSADLADLTPGATVKVRVFAANGAGESAPSAVVESTVPSLADAA